MDLNTLSADTDSDGFPDATDPIPLDFNFSDGDVAVNGNIDAGDYLVMLRLVMNLVQPDDTHLAHGDLYPPGNPDGVIGIQDLLLLEQLLLP